MQGRGDGKKAAAAQAMSRIAWVKDSIRNHKQACSSNTRLC